MTSISTAFSPLMGLGISIFSIIEAAKHNPEIEDILFGTIDKTLQPKQIEEELSRRTNRLIELFCQTDNDFRPLFLSGSNISKGQFKEIAVKIGLKADINGNVIPHVIDGNLLVNGIYKPSDYYIIASSGRKSLIVTKTKLGEPGAFSKKAAINTTSAILRKDYEMCNSVVPVFYTIHSDLFLKLLDKRYYYDRGEMKLLNYKKDKHLIGKTVPFRSPCTCNSDDGVCMYCYGDLFEINKDLSSPGNYSATVELENTIQAMLSLKHLQYTQSNEISFTDDFYKIFDLISTEISLRDNPDIDIDDIYIRIGNVEAEESEDEDIYFTYEFDIANEDGKILYTFSEGGRSKLYLSNKLLSLYRSQSDKSKPFLLEDFDDEDSVLFKIEIHNKEVTRSAQNIEKLLNTNDRLGCVTISDICQKMAENKIDAGQLYNFVHHEMILRELIRKRSNEYTRARFSTNDDPKDYKILRLNDALFKNPSAVVSLSYGFLKKQLVSPELYDKTEPSQLDPLFVRTLSDVVD
jgi:hypothetical protein